MPRNADHIRHVFLFDVSQNVRGPTPISLTVAVKNEIEKAMQDLELI